MATLLIDESELLNFINHDLLLNRPMSETISYDTNLIASGIIDSLSLIQLVTYLEKRMSLQIEDMDVNPDNFQSIITIIKYLKNRVLS